MKPPRMKVFKERFNKLRGEKSQEEFAEFLGISRPTVGFYENGSRLPDALTLSQIARKCNVSADWLLGLSNTRQYSGTLSDACNYTGLSEEVIDFFHSIRSSELIDYLNTFLSPFNFTHVPAALNSFADAIHASMFDSLVGKTIDRIFHEDYKYLESENINTILLGLQLSHETLSRFSTDDIPSKLKTSVQHHMLTAITMPVILNFLENNPTQMYRYAVNQALEKALDKFAKHVEDTAQLPVDQSALEHNIKAIYEHRKSCNDLPKNDPTPDGLPF